MDIVGAAVQGQREIVGPLLVISGGAALALLGQAIDLRPAGLVLHGERGEGDRRAVFQGEGQILLGLEQSAVDHDFLMAEHLGELPAQLDLVVRGDQRGHLLLYLIHGEAVDGGHLLAKSTLVGGVHLVEHPVPVHPLHRHGKHMSAAENRVKICGGVGIPNEGCQGLEIQPKTHAVLCVYPGLDLSDAGKELLLRRIGEGTGVAIPDGLIEQLQVFLPASLLLRRRGGKSGNGQGQRTGQSESGNGLGKAHGDSSQFLMVLSYQGRFKGNKKFP